MPTGPWTFLPLVIDILDIFNWINESRSWILWYPFHWLIPSIILFTYPLRRPNIDVSKVRFLISLPASSFYNILVIRVALISIFSTLLASMVFMWPKQYSSTRSLCVLLIEKDSIHSITSAFILYEYNLLSILSCGTLSKDFSRSV